MWLFAVVNVTTWLMLRNCKVKQKKWRTSGLEMFSFTNFPIDFDLWDVSWPWVNQPIIGLVFIRLQMLRITAIVTITTHRFIIYIPLRFPKNNFGRLFLISNRDVTVARMMRRLRNSLQSLPLVKVVGGWTCLLVEIVLLTGSQPTHLWYGLSWIRHTAMPLILTRMLWHGCKILSR